MSGSHHTVGGEATSRLVDARDPPSLASLPCTHEALGKYNHHSQCGPWWGGEGIVGILKEASRVLWEADCVAQIVRSHREPGVEGLDSSATTLSNTGRF